MNDGKLIWLDMEMTGLDCYGDRILEIAIVITSKDLEILDCAPVYVIHQEDRILDSMDNWNKTVHSDSGLISKVKQSKLTELEVEQLALEFLGNRIDKKASPMCGNSICQDRRFMSKWMPELEDYFHYRNLDISSIKELVKRWKPGILKNFVKTGNHQALQDVYDSIEEAKYYREHFINLD